MQMTEEDADTAILEAFAVYETDVLAALRPFACRLQLAMTVQRCARALIGSCGGFGHQHGLKLNPHSQKAQHTPEYGPYFVGADGATMLRRLKLECVCSPVYLSRTASDVVIIIK